MRLKGNRQKLLEAFTVVGSVVAPRSIKPILQNVRMVVDPEGATLLATDLEVAIRYKVILDDITEGGDVLLPANRMLGILRESEGDQVEISAEDGPVEVRCGNGLFKVLAMDPEEFPVVPAFDDAKAIIMEREPLRLLMRKTMFATAKERTRYAFNGVRFEVEGDEARMIATDGKRMAVKVVPIDNPDRLNVGRIIPVKGLQTFDKVMTDQDAKVSISLQEKQVMLKTARAEVSSRLLEGSFPKYEAVIPKETPLSAAFKRQDILSALRRAAILTNDESRSVKLSFEGDRLILTGRALDVGEARIELETTFEGEPLQVAFNPDYVVEGIKAMEAETVTMRFSGRDTPARIDGEENFTYVVMPITLRSG